MNIYYLKIIKILLLKFQVYKLIILNIFIKYIYHLFLSSTGHMNTLFLQNFLKVLSPTDNYENKL